MTTALIYDPIFLEHITPRNHPEQPERVQAALQVLEALNWLERDGLVVMTPRAASVDELAAVHDPAYILRVKAAAEEVALEEQHIGRLTRFIATGTYVSYKSISPAIN